MSGDEEFKEVFIQFILIYRLSKEMSEALFRKIYAARAGDVKKMGAEHEADKE